MKCPNCDESDAILEEITLKGGSLRYICTACGYTETR